MDLAPLLKPLSLGPLTFLPEFKTKVLNLSPKSGLSPLVKSAPDL